jgi:hypothetical protein
VGLFAFSYYNSVRLEVTQAKYTLVYSWLFLPLAYEGVEYLSVRLQLNSRRRAYWSVLGFSLLWQFGVVLGTYIGPPTIADKLAVMSPTLPLRYELRQLIAWLKAQRVSSVSVVLDEYNYEGTDIFRFSGIEDSKVFLPKTRGYQDVELRSKVEDFIQKRESSLLICSPDGPVGRALTVDHHQELEMPSLHLLLHRIWIGPHWVVYAIQPSR